MSSAKLVIPEIRTISISTELQ